MPVSRGSHWDTSQAYTKGHLWLSAHLESIAGGAHRTVNGFRFPEGPYELGPCPLQVALLRLGRHTLATTIVDADT